MPAALKIQQSISFNNRIQNHPPNRPQGKLTDAFWGRVAVTRYQSSKATVTYADFLLASASAGAGPAQPGAGGGGGGTRPGTTTGGGGGKRIQIS